MSSLISICSPYDDEGALNASEVSASKILFAMHDDSIFNPERPKKINYIYDYGDHWELEILVIGFERIGSVTAKLIGGAGACPPEDCGGIHGYQDLKKSLETGKPSVIHGDHYHDWLKGCGYDGFDPNVFDIKSAQTRLDELG